MTPPVTWDRIQVLLRILILGLLGALGIPIGWVFGMLYLVLPIAAALLVSHGGPEAYLTQPAPRIARGLRYWNAFLAYAFLLTDRFPLGDEELEAVKFAVEPQGSPTVGSALLRLVTSLPEALVVALLASLGCVVWLIAAAGVLFSREVPSFAFRYFHFLLELQARLLAYHASLVEPYPPLREPSHEA